MAFAVLIHVILWLDAKTRPACGQWRTYFTHDVFTIRVFDGRISAKKSSYQSKA